MVEHAMSKLGNIMPNRRDHTVVVAKTDILGFVQMPSDGNCLFAALAIGAKRKWGAEPVPVDQRKAYGVYCRNEYLKYVKHLEVQNTEVMGLSIESLLTDLDWTSVEEYLEGMTPPIESRRQWGGFVEAVIMGHYWQMQVAFFLDLNGEELAMMNVPVGAGTKGPLVTQTRRALALVLVTDSSV